jgi:hypothetical protein
MVLKAPTESEQPGDIAKYFDREGWYQTEFNGKVRVCVRLAVRTEYGQLRFLVMPLLSWVPAERVQLLSEIPYTLSVLSRTALRIANFLRFKSV